MRRSRPGAGDGRRCRRRPARRAGAIAAQVSRAGRHRGRRGGRHRGSRGPARARSPIRSRTSLRRVEATGDPAGSSATSRSSARVGTSSSTTNRTAQATALLGDLPTVPSSSLRVLHVVGPPTALFIRVQCPCPDALPVAETVASGTPIRMPRPRPPICHGSGGTPQRPRSPSEVIDRYSPVVSWSGADEHAPTPATAPAELTVPVVGMTCASCVNRIERFLSRADGVSDATVNLATERATVRFDPGRHRPSRDRRRRSRPPATRSDATAPGTQPPRSTPPRPRAQPSVASSSSRPIAVDRSSGSR